MRYKGGKPKSLQVFVDQTPYSRPYATTAA